MLLRLRLTSGNTWRGQTRRRPVTLVPAHPTLSRTDNLKVLVPKRDYFYGFTFALPLPVMLVFIAD